MNDDMNDDMKEKLSEVLIELMEGLKQTKDFAVEQAPDVVQQILAWGFWSSWLLFVSSLVFITLLLLSMYKIHKVCLGFKNGYGMNDRGDPVLLLQFVPFILVVVSICIMIHNTTWLKIWIAPKLFILEYIRRML